METRRLLIAALLSVIVVIGWQILFPPPERPAPSAETEVETAQPADEEAEASAEEIFATEEAVLEEGPVETEPVAAEAIEAVAASSEELVVVDGEGFRAEFTNRGAQLVSFRLERHRDAEGGEVDLVRRREGYPLPFALVSPQGDELPASSWLFAAEQGKTELGEHRVGFRFAGSEGRVEKTFVFAESGLIQVQVEAQGIGDWAILLGPGIRNPAPSELEDRFEIRSGIYLSGEDVTRIAAQGADELASLGTAGLRWVGLEDRYFLVAAVPERGLGEATFLPVLASGAEGSTGEHGFEPFPLGGELSDGQKEAIRELQLLLQPRSEELAVTTFWGGKEFHRLASLPHGLEESVQLGFFWFISRPLLVGLRWIHENMVGNYGWAIILMTVLIRLLLFPLNHKSTVSMRKMQQLNPKIQAVRQKYRSKLKDKQGRPNPEMQRKMNEEVMAIYRAEGVNPAGGCLPMVLQIPVLFAFYRLLSSAIELRHAPWLLWIQDLSAPDPYYVLPIVMGASQFIQQRMTPTTGDPMQRRLFLLMPIFFTILFLGFPSGLVLYWLTNNILGIAQQAAYGKFSIGDQSGDGKQKGKRSKKEADRA